MIIPMHLTKKPLA
jgi:hypothetical protein